MIQTPAFAAGPRERGYAEWFSWARTHVGGDTAVDHACAMAAIDAVDRGERAVEWAAHQAARERTGPGWSTSAPPAVRGYAEWFDWSRVNLGLSGEAQHQAAAAALNVVMAGGDANGAAAAAQRVAAPIIAAAMAAPVARGNGEALQLVRDPRRIAALLVIGNFPYYLWWVWQVFALSRMERFPRQHSFWTILVPIYGLVTSYHVLDDLKRAEANTAGSSTFNPGLVLGLAVASNVVGRLGSNNLWVAAAVGLISGAILGPAGYLWQDAANRYLAARYPGGAMYMDISLGEGVAIVLGILVWALILATAAGLLGS